jgi:hypothetical protein
VIGQASSKVGQLGIFSPAELTSSRRRNHEGKTEQ